jgi:hypothetical protein
MLVQHLPRGGHTTPSGPSHPSIATVPLDLDDLTAKAKASRDAVRALSADPPAEVAEIERQAKARASRYELPENARHRSIQRAGLAVNESTAAFARVCNAMEFSHPATMNLVLGDIDRYMLQTLNQTLQRMAGDMTEAAVRGDLHGVDVALKAAAQALDPADKEFLGGMYLTTLRLGSLTDVGNAFVNIHATRLVALKRYATGKEPSGWRARLPRPMQAALPELVCIALEKGVDTLLGSGIAGVIPMGATVVGLVRLPIEIRGERRRRSLAFRRGDVDDMLDLSDQVTAAQEAAQGHLATVQSTLESLSKQT